MASRKIVAPIAVGLCRDEYHRYFWEGDGPLVSVTTVEKILYSFPLERWKLEGVARRALRDLDILIPLRDRGDEEAAIRLLLDNGARHDIVVAATHGLFVGGAVERLAALPVRRLVVTDTLGGMESLALPVEVTSIAPLLATTIRRLHRDEPIGELLAGT